MLQDAEYFQENLSHVDGSGNTSQVVIENIKAMPAPEEDPPDNEDTKHDEENENEKIDDNSTKEIEQTNDDEQSPSENAPVEGEKESSPSGGDTPQPIAMTPEDELSNDGQIKNDDNENVALEEGDNTTTVESQTDGNTHSEDSEVKPTNTSDQNTGDDA